jgi:hypothetical protein
MIELRVYCRQLYHSGMPQTIVRVQVEDSVQALLQGPFSSDQSAFAQALLTKVQAILKNAARA